MIAEILVAKLLVDKPFVSSKGFIREMFTQTELELMTNPSEEFAIALEEDYLATVHAHTALRIREILTDHLDNTFTVPFNLNPQERRQYMERVRGAMKVVKYGWKLMKLEEDGGEIVRNDEGCTEEIVAVTLVKNLRDIFEWDRRRDMVKFDKLCRFPPRV